MIRVLDLFSGGGGSAMGIHQTLEEAGIEHEIIGIDNRPFLKSIYPFTFICLNVLNLKVDWMKGFDIIWASPPCQAYTIATSTTKTVYKELITPTRKMLQETGKIYIIENVVNAPLNYNLYLCGCMFNLGVFRRRHFEVSGFYIDQPVHRKHKGKIGDGNYFRVLSGSGCWLKKGDIKGDYDDWCNVMGINWIEGKLPLSARHPLSEAVPPAYSKYIIQQYLKKQPTLDKFF